MKKRLAVCLVALAIARAQSGDWLDSPPKPWNRPGRSLPKAPPDVDRDEISPSCKPLPHRTDTPEHRALTEAGWLVFASFRDGGVVVVGAAGSLDGMCRPDQYQDFVFVNGKFAGALSPTLMGARSDGGAVKISFPGKNKIQAEFDRYTREDPLCCPSRVSEAQYEIRVEGGQPVVILTSVRTRKA